MRRNPESRIILATSSASSAVPEKHQRLLRDAGAPRGSRRAPWSMNQAGPDRPFLTREASPLHRPLLPPHCSVGIKEIGGVEPFSRIRHGQCSLDWIDPPPIPPEGRAGGLNRAGIWWRCAPGERLSAFITTLFGDAAAGCPGSPRYLVEWD